MHKNEGSERMQTTENLGLNLPESTDFFDVGHQNENMQVLDESIGEINETLSDKVDKVDGKLKFDKVLNELYDYGIELGVM